MQGENQAVPTPSNRSRRAPPRSVHRLQYAMGSPNQGSSHLKETQKNILLSKEIINSPKFQISPAPESRYDDNSSSSARANDDNSDQRKASQPIRRYRRLNTPLGSSQIPAKFSFSPQSRIPTTPTESRANIDSPMKSNTLTPRISGRVNVHTKQPTTPMSESGLYQLRQKSSWREEKSNEELQARFFAGLYSPPEPSSFTDQGNYRHHRKSDNCHNREIRSVGSPLDAKQQAKDSRDAPPSVEKVNRKPRLPPTDLEWQEIRGKVQDLISAGDEESYVTNKAATTINAVLRGRKERTLMALHRGARKIQAIWRGVGPRRAKNAALQQLKLKQFSALQIQCSYRILLARRQILMRRSARTIQSYWRCYSTRTSYERGKQRKTAATKIQAAWRSFACYTQFAMTVYDVVTVQRASRRFIARKRLRRHYMATKIQKIMRGHSTRHKFTVLWNEHVKIVSATVIQRNWRGCQARKQCAIYLSCIIDIQRLVRGTLERINYLEQLGCVIVSQSLCRRWLARQKVNRILKSKYEYHAAKAIQATFRCYHYRQHYLHYQRAKFAAIKIQSSWRCFLAFSDYIFTLTDIVTVQRKVRLILKRQNAAKKIQSIYRGYMCYTYYCTVLYDIVTIQRLIRGHLGRKEGAVEKERHEQRLALERCLQNAAISIQSAFRGYQGRLRTASIRRQLLMIRAATLLQSQWRAYFMQGVYWYKLECVIRIQSLVRKVLGRLRYTEKVCSVILIQCTVRRWYAIRLYHQERLINSLFVASKQVSCLNDKAARAIQIMIYNTHKFRQQNAAATKLQSFFRMVRAMVDLEIALQIKRRKERKERKLRKKKSAVMDDCSKGSKKFEIVCVDLDDISVCAEDYGSQVKSATLESSLRVLNQKQEQSGEFKKLGLRSPQVSKTPETSMASKSKIDSRSSRQSVSEDKQGKRSVATIESVSSGKVPVSITKNSNILPKSLLPQLTPTQRKVATKVLSLPPPHQQVRDNSKSSYYVQVNPSLDDSDAGTEVSELTTATNQKSASSQQIMRFSPSKLSPALPRSHSDSNLDIDNKAKQAPTDVQSSNVSVNALHSFPSRLGSYRTIQPHEGSQINGKNKMTVLRNPASLRSPLSSDATITLSNKSRARIEKGREFRRSRSLSREPMSKKS